jgi:hypothetical protein
MSSITLDAISQHLENAQTLVGLCKTMRCGHRQFLLTLSLNAVIESLELLRLEVRGERMAAAPVLGASDELEAAEAGTSPLSSPASGAAAQDAFPTGSRSPSPARPEFLEPLRVSPAPTPRPHVDLEAGMPALEEVAIEVAPAEGARMAQQPFPVPVTERTGTYKDNLLAAGSPPVVYLPLPRKNRRIELRVDYSQRVPMSSYVEPSGVTFHGTLRRVAGRAKYLAGYKPAMDSREAPEAERISDVDVRNDIMFAAPDGTHKFLSAMLYEERA